MKIKDEEFDLFITNDQNLKFQVNKKRISFSFLDLNSKSNRYNDLLSVMPFLNRELIKLANTALVFKKDNNSTYIFSNSGLKEWQNFEE